MDQLLISLSAFFLISLSSCRSRSEKPEQTNNIKVAINYLSPASDSAMFLHLNLDFPGLEEVRNYIQQGDIVKAKSAYLDFRRNIIMVRWKIDPADRPTSAASKTYPQADRIMKHLIEPSMSAPETFIGKDINWEFNPVDPSLPHFTKEWTWCNLNRMPFWNTLGRAYWETLDEKYANEWIDQMTDWVEDNPVPLNEGASNTLTWRTIESGIRMSGSWMNAYYYFLNSPSLTPDAHLTFLKGVVQHAQRLAKITLDYPERGGNWVTMECNGLGTIGILFPELRDSQKYVDIAFNKLTEELDRQVYPDGAQVELTPGYHQVSRSNFMDLARLAQMNNVKFPGEYMGKLKKMYEYNLYLMDPSGILPPFNDAGPTRTSSSLREAYEIWKDDQFLFGATFGKEGKKPPFDSYFFNYAGYYIMRSGWGYDDNCLYFDAGPVGFGHEHEDMLNLYLYSRGKILLTEPGTYSYDLSKWRRYILSTPAHNTIIVDGKEQHRGDIPECRLINAPLKNPWVTTPLFDYGAGTYSRGYQENQYRAVQYMPREYVGLRDTSISHTRHVIFLKPYYYFVLDQLEGSGPHTFDSHYNLNASDAVIDTMTMSVTSLSEDSIRLALFPMDTENLSVKIVKGQEEPILGWLPSEKRPIPTVVYTKQQEAPAQFATLIYPYFLNFPEVSSESIADGIFIAGKKIKTPIEDAVILINRSDKNIVRDINQVVTPGFATDARMILVRIPKGTDREYYGLYNLSEFRGKNISFKLSVRSSLVIAEMNNKVLVFNPEKKDLEAKFSIPLRKKVPLPAGLWMELSGNGVTESDLQIKSLFPF